MFRIFDGRDSFFQWDLNRRLIVEDNSINEVHFCNKTDDSSLVCVVRTEDGLRVADVPNILLQTDWSIRAYAYCTDHTIVEEIFKVHSRTKPADYIYTETEIKNYDDLKARVDEIERNGVSQEAVDAAVSAYLTEHPIEAGATAEEAAQIEANKNAIAQLEINKATKEYVDTTVSAINIPTKVSAFENDAGYLTQHQSLEGYAKTTDIPDVSGYQTEAQVIALIQANMPASGDEVSY